MLTVVAKVFSDTLIVFAAKMWVKATHIFSAKNIYVFSIFQDRNLKVTLAKNFIKFWTTGPWFIGISCFCDVTPVLFHSMGKFSRQRTDDIISYFPTKQDLRFETICMECQILFSWKKLEKYFKMLYAENFTQHAKL